MTQYSKSTNWGGGSGGGSSSFTGLNDTPSSYVGHGSKSVQVNVAENALEFVTPTGTDELTKVSSNDSTAKYLEDAITSANSAITLSTLNDGADEDLQLTFVESAITITESQISDLGSYISDISGSPLSELSDSTITAIGSNEILKWSGSAWINNTLAEAGISATGHTHTESDITDLQSYILDITGEPLGDLSDVTITGPASNDILQWSGSAWVDRTLAEAGISAASHTHTESDITDLQDYLVNISEDLTPQLGASLDVNGFHIVSASAGDINITPNTTGDLILDGLKWPQADGTANYVLETDGAGQLSWVAQASGSGDVVGPASATDNAIARFNNTTGKLIQDSANSTVSDNGEVALFRDNATSGNSSSLSFNRTRSGAAIGSNDTAGEIFFKGAYDGTPNYNTFGSIRVRPNEVVTTSSTNMGRMEFFVGDGAGAQTEAMEIDEANIYSLLAHHFTDGTTSLPGVAFTSDPDTGMWRSATNTLNFSTGGTERLELSSSGIKIGTTYTLPLTDGTNGYVLSTNGSGTVSWVANAGSGMSDVVDDTTPQLGGSLDVNGNSIVSASAGDISITPDTTGDLILDGLKWPQADGTANYVLETDGAGQLSWVAQSGGGVTGTGTTNTVSKWTSSTAQGDSSITDDGTAVDITGPDFLVSHNSNLEQLRVFRDSAGLMDLRDLNGTANPVFRLTGGATGTATNTSDRIGTVEFYGGSGSAHRQGAEIEGLPTETWSDGVQYGTSMLFKAVENGATSLTEYFRLNAATGMITTGTGVGLAISGSSAGIATIVAPASFTNYTLTLPTDDGASGEYLQTNGSGTLTWASAGSGDVTAASNMTDNSLVKGDGGSKGVQDSGILIDDSDNITAVTSIDVDGTTDATSATTGVITTDGGIGAAKNIVSGGAMWSVHNDIGNSGTTKTITMTDGNVQTITLNNNCTLTFAGEYAGQAINLIIKQDATGSRLITWPTISWVGGSAPTLSTVGSSVDIIGLLYDGTDWYGGV
jgi:hypothetical protein